MDKKLRLELLFRAAGNVRGFLGGVKGDADKTGKALAGARQRVQELQRTSKDVTAFRALQGGLTGTREKIAAARAEVARLGAAMDATGNPTRQMARGFEVAKTRLRELETQQGRQVDRLREVRSRLEAAGVSTEALGAHERRLARDLQRANEELAEQSRRMELVADRQARMNAARGRYDRTQQFAGTAAGAGASAIGAGTALGAPLVLSSREAMTFQEAMLDVRKVVDFDTPQQFREMRSDILDLSIALNQPAEGMAAIVAAAGQAKIARAELRGFADDAGKMGVAFDTTADDAGRKMATWRTAFGMTQPAVRGLADQINYLGDNGNATALQISDVVTRVGPLAGVAGAAAAEVAALGSTIVGMGVEQEIAATGIKNTMLALTKGEAATKAQKKAYEALGLEARNVARAMQVDAGGTIIDVLERVRGLSAERQTAVLTQLFGSESVAAIAPMLSQLDVLKTNLEAVGDASLYAGSMQAEFENRQSGAATATGQAMKAIKAAAIDIGDTFLPAIAQGATALRGIAQDVRAFAAAHPGVTKAAGVMLAVVAGGLLVFGGLALAVAAVLGPFALLQLTLTQSGILFGPLGRIIGGFAGRTLPVLGRGLLIAGRGFLGFGAAAARAGLLLLANPITWIVLGIVAAVALLAGAAYLIYRNWGGISAWFGRLWTGIRNIGSQAIGFLGRLFMTFSPAGLMIGAFMRAWPALQGLGGRFLALGRHLLCGLINGVLGGIPALIRAVMSAGGSIISGFKQRLGIRSPSRVFAQLGDFTMQGLGVGIERTADAPLRRMRATAAALAAAATVTVPAVAWARPDPQDGVARAATFAAQSGEGERPRPLFESGQRLQAQPSPASRNAGAPGAPGASGVHIGHVTIQIVQQPGQSADQLAREVLRILQSPNLSQLGDDGQAYGTE